MSGSIKIAVEKMGYKIVKFLERGIISVSKDGRAPEIWFPIKIKEIVKLADPKVIVLKPRSKS